jgi:hypothetical protein
VSTQTVLRDNRTREVNQQLADSNYGGTGIPVLNDAALAESIEQWKATDISYQRAQNEEQREQIESAYRATQSRLAAAKQVTKDTVAAAKQNQQNRDDQAGEILVNQMQALTDTFPPNWTPGTLRMDQLRQLTDLRQQVNDLAAATGAPGLADGILESGGPLSPSNRVREIQQHAPPAQAKPETFPDGQAVHVTQNTDSTLHVEYATGEKFDGDPVTVTQRIGQAHVNTKVWARQQRAQQAPIQPQQPDPQLNQQPQVEQPTEQGRLADYWAREQAEALAKRFGFSGENELQEWGEKMTAFQKETEDSRIAAEFTSRAPDFPSTPEASSALIDIVDKNGWDYTVDALEAAHTLAMRHHVYEPLSAEAQQIANGAVPQMSRPAPPPMIHGGNPEMSNSAVGPYDMPMQDLRKAAIKQELERNSPGYR